MEDKGNDRGSGLKPHNDFSRETKRGNGSPWRGLDKDTKPARREVDKGGLAPSPTKDT